MMSNLKRRINELEQMTGAEKGIRIFTTHDKGKTYWRNLVPGPGEELVTREEIDRLELEGYQVFIVSYEVMRESPGS